MSATFACPHCGASYPVKPVLVGRAVRCTTCKHPFKLREDGIADKVADAPASVAAPVPATPPPAAAPEPAMRAPAPSDRPPTDRVPTASITRGSRTERLTKQQEDARRSMAASLANAASGALSAETVKREAEAEKKAERKKSAIKSDAAGAEGRVGQIGPAVLTGDGAREHHNNLVWLLGAIGGVGALCALVFLFSLKTPQRRAINHYTSMVEGERARYPERIPAIQERAWVVGVPPLTDPGRVKIGATRTIPFLPAREMFANRLKGMTYLPATQLWTTPERGADIDKVWSARKDRAATLAAVQARKIPVIDQRAVATDLEAAGWNADDVGLLLDLMQANTDRNGTNWIAKKLLAGELPDAIEVTTFAGVKATRLVDLGGMYRSREVDYSGRLLHFVGEGWPKEWKVFEIKTTSSN